MGSRATVSTASLDLYWKIKTLRVLILKYEYRFMYRTINSDGLF